MRATADPFGTVKDRSTLGSRDVLADAYLGFAALWLVLTALGYLGATDAPSWYEHRLPDPYDVADYRTGVGFFFAPPVAFLIYPLTLLPWPLFATLFVGLSLAALRFLAGRYALLCVFFPPVFWELQSANVNLLIAAAAVIGMRRPGAWSFVLLTKVTPGVGLLWFLVRREWRHLAAALIATSLVVGITYAVAPQLWSEWWALLTGNAGWDGPGYFTVPLSLPVRLLIAAVVVGWGAVAGRPWTIAVSISLALPVLWFNGLSALVAAFALWDGTKTESATTRQRRSIEPVT